MKNLSHKHDSHDVVIGPGGGPHYKSLQCADCNKHIAWMNKQQVKSIESLFLGELLNQDV
jgi:hypothetical protein